MIGTVAVALSLFGAACGDDKAEFRPVGTSNVSDDDGGGGDGQGAGGAGTGGQGMGGDAGGGGDEPLPGSQVFNLSLVHRIDVVVDDPYMEQLATDYENRVPCTFTFDGVTLGDVGIRQKGGYGSISTLDGKPGFSVKFNELVPGQKLDGLKKLLLNNALQDPTFLNEHLGYEFARGAGLPASYTSHAIVTLNGFTYGIYVLKESVDEKFLARNFGEDNDGGNLYEGPYGADFPNGVESFDLKDEDEGKTRDDLIALTDVVMNTPDAALAAALSPLLDVDELITSYAVDTQLGHWDGYAGNTNNFYLYNNPIDGRFVFMPHGMDQLSPGACTGYDGGYPFGYLTGRVRDVPELDALYQARLSEVVEQGWDVAALQARVDQVSAILHDDPPQDERTQADLASFDSSYETVRANIAGCPGGVGL